MVKKGGKSMGNEIKKTEEQILAFIEKLKYYGDGYRNEWYELMLKRPEIISEEFFEFANTNTNYLSYIFKGLEAGLDISEIKAYLNIGIREGLGISIGEFFDGIISGIEIEKIECYAQKKFAFYISDLNVLARKLDTATLKKYLELDIPANQIVTILRVLASEWSVTEGCIEILSQPWEKLQFESLEEALKKLRNKEISFEHFQIIANHQFNLRQMEEVIRACTSKLSFEQITFLAKPTMSSVKMYYIVEGILHEIPWKHIKFYSNNSFSSVVTERIYYCLRDGFSIETAKFLIKAYERFEDRIKLKKFWENSISILKSGFELNELEQMIELGSYHNDVLEIIQSGIRHKLAKKDIVSSLELCAETKIISSLQIEEIFYGFKHGLSKEQIKLYAKSHIKLEKMRIIKDALRAGMSIQEAQKMVEERDYAQMTEYIKQQEINERKNTELYKLISEILLN